VDADIAALLGLDPADDETRALSHATERDMQLVERLVRARHEAGLTQQQVAERMGCSQPNVSSFERVGGDPHLSTVRRYAVAVGVSLHWRVVSETPQEAAVISFPLGPRAVSSGADPYYGRTTPQAAAP
jgi:transcriptional regulator with XRE-family HTH domain